MKLFNIFLILFFINFTAYATTNNDKAIAYFYGFDDEIQRYTGLFEEQMESCCSKFKRSFDYSGFKEKLHGRETDNKNYEPRDVRLKIISGNDVLYVDRFGYIKHIKHKNKNAYYYLPPSEVKVFVKEVISPPEDNF